MCGEHPAWSKSQTARPGSSPHVRGTLLMLIRVPRLSGIIPACAGNTRVAGCKTPVFRDHPRMCGEHPAWSKSQTARPGSSPHVRGTPCCRSVRSGGAGIIPACAGNTSCCSSASREVRDHPRMCGEHDLIRVHVVDGLGSSPHVRGTLLANGASVCAFGIIPACAGNTWVSLATPTCPRDHPRMCGEHLSNVGSLSR